MYVFSDNESSWTKKGNSVSSAPWWRAGYNFWSLYGNSVAVLDDGDRLVVGDGAHDVVKSYDYDLSRDVWTCEHTFRGEGVGLWRLFFGTNFGCLIALTGDRRWRYSRRRSVHGD